MLELLESPRLGSHDVGLLKVVVAVASKRVEKK